jgi:hypothetical protein
VGVLKEGGSVDHLRVRFELDGLVLLRITGTLATAHLVPADGHFPLLVVPEGNLHSSDGLPISSQGVALPPWDPGSGSYRYVDLRGLTGRVGAGGGLFWERTGQTGWTDLHWALDLGFLTGLTEFPDGKKKPRPKAEAVLEFASGHIMARRPLSTDMRKALWKVKGAGGTRIQWLADGLTVEVPIRAEQGLATIVFAPMEKTANQAPPRELVLKEGPDGEEPSVALSNMCRPAPDATDDVPGAMPDVAAYGIFLGAKLTPPENASGPAGILSPNSTRCPPAYLIG